MKAIEIASDIAMLFEGFRPRPYLCPASIWTIGFGTTRYPDGRKVTPQDKQIDKITAETYLRSEISRSISAALRYCPVLVSDDNRLAAIADFVYNLGAGRLQASTLRRRVNQQDWSAVKLELMKWVRGGGRILPGLVKRRAVEASLIG